MSLNVINIRYSENQGKYLDQLIIPNEIYDLTINKQTEKIQNYFINNPKLLMSFVGFNKKLKYNSFLINERKCSCFYKIPWETRYEKENNIKNVVLLFNQQIEIYNYMIKHWYPNLNKDISNIRYISSIALDMILEFRRFNYNINNNLDCSGLWCKSYIKNKFINNQEILLYIKRINSY